MSKADAALLGAPASLADCVARRLCREDGLARTEPVDVERREHSGESAIS